MRRIFPVLRVCVCYVCYVTDYFASSGIHRSRILVTTERVGQGVVQGLTSSAFTNLHPVTWVGAGLRPRSPGCRYAAILSWWC